MDLSHGLRHNRWANLVLLEHCAGLAGEALGARVPGAFGAVHETLWHIAYNEETYLGTLRGEMVEPSLRERAGPPPLSELREFFERYGAELAEYASGLPDDHMLYGTRQGVPYELPARVPLVQTVHHGSVHRQDITLSLAAAGFATPEIDTWAWWMAGFPD